MNNLIPFSQLKTEGIGWEFEGYKYDDTDVTFIIVEAPPGTGPELHSHPYKEVFIILEGKGLFKIGDTITEVASGNIVIVPPGMPHKFVNTGTGLLKQVDIHLNKKFITNWLED